MDSDDEMMFHQMTEEMTALQMDDQENEEVIRILVARWRRRKPNPNAEDLGLERRAT